MNPVVSLLLVALLIGLEATLWVINPMHLPATFLPARAFGLQLFREPGPAMEPTIRPDERVWVSSWPYWSGQPRIGDIVAFVYPGDPSIADVKRIVATGGSSIEIRNGWVLVDGRKQQSTYPMASDGHTRADLNIQTIPANCFFVMGDNRAVSEDSRNYGVIARDRIIGRRWF